MEYFKLKKLDPDLPTPRRELPDDSGLSVYVREAITLEPFTPTKVPLGIAIELPLGFEGQIRPRSGKSLDGIHVSFGTIDRGYRGEVSAIVTWYEREDTMQAVESLYIPRGTRIAQLVIAPVSYAEPMLVSELSKSDRGDRGFGSTGD